MNNPYAQPNYPNIGYNNFSFQQQFPVQQKGITTVAIINGEDGVESYPVAAGNTTVLMDFNHMRFYLKTTDVYGRPLPVESYSFNKFVQQESTNDEPAKNQNEYVNKDEFEKIASMVTELYKELKG